MSAKPKSIISLFTLIVLSVSLARFDVKAIATSDLGFTVPLLSNSFLGEYNMPAKRSEESNGDSDWPDASEIEKAIAASALDSAILVPAGYGRYCSAVWADGYNLLSVLKGQSSKPCDDLLKTRPNGTIMRAGLWSHNGKNNVMLKCQGNGVGIWRGTGANPIYLALAAAKNQNYCVFNISPTKLAIFNAPYGKFVSYESSVHSGVTVTNTHDFNIYDVPVNVRDFGQMPVAGHPNAHSFDRKGRQQCRTGTKDECCPDKNDADNCKPAGCEKGGGHGGYDWLMPEGKPIRTVAAGRIVMERTREVDLCPYASATRYQKEIYILHTVGKDGYVEKFLTYYAHMKSTSVDNGDTVVAGQEIGKAGSTGCSSAVHLHFGAARLTNTSGFYEYPYETVRDGCGDNAHPILIDPFGWAAPRNVDPGAWLALGVRNDHCLGKNVTNPGAFSINLWKSGSAPPNKD